MKNCPRLFFWDGENFGDQLNKYLFKGKMIPAWDYSLGTKYANVMGIGSIANYLKIPVGKIREYITLYVFGTGWDGNQASERDYHELNELSDFRKNVKIYAVRGKYTYDYLAKIYPNLKKEEIVFGDGGLLITARLAEAINVSKKYSLGIITHYADEKDARWRQWCDKIDNSTIISVKLDPIEFISRLMQCRRILSTAMHPLIAADALGIPNLWCVLPNGQAIDMSFKFNDYYSVYNKIKSPYILNDLSEDIMQMIDEQYDIEHEQVKKIISDLEKSYDVMMRDMCEDHTQVLLKIFNLKKEFRFNVRRIKNIIRSKESVKI